MSYAYLFKYIIIGDTGAIFSPFVFLVIAFGDAVVVVGLWSLYFGVSTALQDSVSFTSGLAVALAIVFLVITAGITVFKWFDESIAMPRLLHDITDINSIWKLFTVFPVLMTAYICHFNDLEYGAGHLLTQFEGTYHDHQVSRRAVAKYLQTLFEKEAEGERKVFHIDSLLTGKSRKEASMMFFETLSFLHQMTDDDSQNFFSQVDQNVSCVGQVSAWKRIIQCYSPRAWKYDKASLSV